MPIQRWAKVLTLTLMLLMVTVGSPPITHAADAPPTKDIVFATVQGPRGKIELKLDLFLPKKKQKAKPPLVVFIHGGGWRNGSYKRCHMPWLADEGFAVASIGYRLSDKAKFPAQVHDCKAAIRWLRAHADRYGYDVTRVAVAGTSAGGHLALMMGLTAGDKSLEGKVGEHLDQSSHVDVIVDYYGPSDFILRSQNQPSKTESPKGPVYLLLGGPASKKKELARQASPAFYVGKQSPPLLIVHGDKDTTVMMDQSQRLVDAYRKHERSVTLHVVPGGKHGGSDYFKGANRKVVVAFLTRHLADKRSGDRK